MGRHIKNGISYGGTVNNATMIKYGTDSTVAEEIEAINNKKNISTNTEYVIGTYNGKPLYKKYYNIGTVGTNAVLVVDSTLTKDYVDRVIECTGTAKRSIDSIRPLPYFWSTSDNILIDINNSSGLTIANASATTITNACISVTYTKTSDL